MIRVALLLDKRPFDVHTHFEALPQDRLEIAKAGNLSKERATPSIFFREA